MGEGKEYVTIPVESGSINISEEVIAVIAGSAAVEVDGVADLHSAPGRDIADLIGKKNLARGVKIRVEDRAVTADVYIIVSLDRAVNEVGEAVQAAVATAVESATGLVVTAVNVHVCGIAMKKEK